MNPTLFALSYAARSVTATGWLLSAGWKLLHPGDFSLAYWRIRNTRGKSATVIARLVAAVEIVAAICLLLPGIAWWIAVPPSVILLIVLSVVLARAGSLDNGCGCWPKPRQEQPRGLYIARNVVFAVLALAGLPRGTADPGLLALALPSGAIVALMLMQLPEIRSVWLAGRKVSEV